MTSNPSEQFAIPKRNRLTLDEVFFTNSVISEETLTAHYGVDPDYIMAVTRSKIRELIAAIHFAKAEPKYFPPQLDPDTGAFEPTLNDEPFDRVTRLATQLTEDLAARYILNPYGWTHELISKDFDTMLSHLPPISTLPA